MAGQFAGLPAGLQQIARRQGCEQRLGGPGQRQALVDRARPLHRGGDHGADRGEHGGDDRQRHQRLDQGEAGYAVRAVFCGTISTPPVSQLTRTSNPIPGRASASTPPHDMPEGKKSIDRPAFRSAQRDASIASSETSSGKRMMRAGRAGADRSRRRIDQRRHLDLPAQRRVAVRLQQRRGLHRIALELGAGGRPRDRRQDDGREQADDGEHAQDFDQRETLLAMAVLSARRWQCRLPFHCRLLARRIRAK